MTIIVVITITIIIIIVNSYFPEQKKKSITLVPEVGLDISPYATKVKNYMQEQQFRQGKENSTVNFSPFTPIGILVRGKAAA